MENADLKGQIQENIFVTTTLQNELRRLKGKHVLDNATTITLGMFKLDIEPISHRFKNNRDTHEDYLKKTIENTNTIHGLIESTCPSFIKPSEKLVAVAPMNKVKKVRFSEPLTSSSNIYKHVESSKTPDSNTPVLPSTGLKSSTSASRSQPTCNKKNDRISQTPSSNMKNNVEVQRNRSQLMNFGLGHNLVSVGQFCDADLEVAFRKNTCFIWNLEGVDLLSGSRDINLYTIYLDDMLKTSPIYLLSKASKTKSWLWHRRLSHLNFSTLNKLAKDGLARGIPKLKFKKDHLCSACALGKIKKSSHQPKPEDTNQEKLYLLHIDVCGPMRVESINGKKHILVIVDDYSRFTWVKFLRSMDKAPDAIFKCIKNIQVCLNAIVHNVRTDNGTEFVNQTLREFYENVSISHQTSVARTPQQNGVIERRNQTLVEAARTMLIFSKAPLFLLAEAINIACYT
ncbi:retrovirus-related pol polyprotein from transposon TNT 1-94 [Tanacetum coccineum]